jgi:hypothetical protein
VAHILYEPKYKNAPGEEKDTTENMDSSDTELRDSPLLWI